NQMVVMCYWRQILMQVQHQCLALRIGKLTAKTSTLLLYRMTQVRWQPRDGLVDGGMRIGLLDIKMLTCFMLITGARFLFRAVEEMIITSAPGGPVFT
ncbi:TPA: hypothetical protein ACRR3V_001133, partial [Morganella morganii]